MRMRMSLFALLLRRMPPVPPIGSSTSPVHAVGASAQRSSSEPLPPLPPASIGTHTRAGWEKEQKAKKKLSSKA